MTQYQGYSAYRATDVAWIPQVPADWQEDRAKFIFKREQRPVRGKDEVVTAFRDGEVVLRRKRRTAGFTQSVKEIGYQGVRAGDLVIHAMDGFAGAIGVSKSDGKCTPVYSICTPLPGRATEPAYYAYLLRDMAQRQFIVALGRGIRERSTEFRFGDFRELILPVPGNVAQKAIVAFLDRESSKIDALIQKQQRLIEVLNENRAALISHAVTKGLDPDVPMRASGVAWLGDVPAHWKVLQFRRLFSGMDQGASPQCAAQPAGPGEWGVLKVGCVNGGIYRESENKRLPKDIMPVAGHEVAVGDFLMSRANTSGLVGSVALVHATEGQVLLSDKIYRLNMDDSVLNRRYGVILLSSAMVRFQLARDSTGASLSMQNISKQSISKMLLPLPPLGEQESIEDQIARLLAPTEDVSLRTAKAIERLQEYRAALISAAVTGQIDVRNEV